MGEASARKRAGTYPVAEKIKPRRVVLRIKRGDGFRPTETIDIAFDVDSAGRVFLNSGTRRKRIRDRQILAAVLKAYDEAERVEQPADAQ